MYFYPWTKFKQFFCSRQFYLSSVWIHFLWWFLSQYKWQQSTYKLCNNNCAPYVLYQLQYEYSLLYGTNIYLPPPKKHDYDTLIGYILCELISSFSHHPFVTIWSYYSDSQHTQMQYLWLRIWTKKKNKIM